MTRLLVCFVLLLGGLPAGADEAGDAERPASSADAVKALKTALKAKRAKDIVGAFDHLRGWKDPSLLGHLIKGLAEVRALEKGVDAELAELQAAYEGLIDKGKELERMRDIGGGSEREVQDFNRKAAKIDNERGRVLTRLRTLEAEFALLYGLAQSAALVAAELIGARDQQGMGEGIEELDKAWLKSKDPRDRMLWIDAVYELPDPPIVGRLHALVADAAETRDVRVAAMNALAAKRDLGLLDRAIAMLSAPPEQFDLVKAATVVLRRLHERKAIEPLIEFLGREDLGSLREDGHLALVSLTGEKHGPYKELWSTWWDDKKGSFVLPTEPMPPGRTDKPPSGVTFYDIHTFSDRMLFVVDISGSMIDDRLLDSNGQTKWDAAKKQLLGAILSLDQNALFNIVIFNHAVTPWQKRAPDASERNKKMAERWINEIEPVGGTNIFDALEMAFVIAPQKSGRPNLDTVFFLTDGKPTAGKCQDPGLILERLRGWNKTTQLRVHAIGVGPDHDAEFMKELARIGDGTYLVR